MIGLVGFLPALLFVAFAATAFLEDGDTVAPEPDPDAPDPGTPIEPEMGGETPEPEPELPETDPGLPAPVTDPAPPPVTEPEPDTDPGTEQAQPVPAPASTPYPAVIDEVDGEDALLTIDISNATLETLATDPNAPDDGFTAFLDSGDTLEVNLGDDVAGTLFVVDIADVTLGSGTDPDQSFLSRAIYILPEGVTPPAEITAETEDALIESLGLIRLGEIDLGQLVTRTDPNNGEITILEDTRQSVLPQVISNRAITTDQAVFA